MNKVDQILSDLTCSNVQGKDTISGRTCDKKTWDGLKWEAKKLLSDWILGHRIKGEVKGFGSRHAKFTYKQGHNSALTDLAKEIMGE